MAFFAHRLFFKELTARSITILIMFTDDFDFRETHQNYLGKLDSLAPLATGMTTPRWSSGNITGLPFHSSHPL